VRLVKPDAVSDRSGFLLLAIEGATSGKRLPQFTWHSLCVILVD
jgi:hypothetical protein